MGHALEKAHCLLAEDGCLIDIRPTDGLRPIEVRIAGESHLAGWLQDANDFLEYVQAEEAVSRAIEQGLFVVMHQRPFTHTYHAQSVEMLHEYLMETSKDAIIDHGVIRRANDLMQTSIPDSEVILSVPVSAVRLRPLPRDGA